jgi:hypothetical protein
MRWDTVIPLAVVAPVMADADVQSVLGATPAFFMAGEREFRVSSMRWTLIADTEAENFERTLVQIDLWVHSLTELRTLSRALRLILHREIEYTIGGIKLWSEYTGTRPLLGAVDGTLAHSLDFRLTYLRARHVA